MKHYHLYLMHGTTQSVVDVTQTVTHDNIQQYFGYNTFGKIYQRCVGCRKESRTDQQKPERLDKAKQYNEDHKEHHKERNKQWAELNKEHLTELVTCNICYEQIQRRRMTAHMKSMICKNYQ